MTTSVVATCCDCMQDVTIPASRVSLLCAAGLTTVGFECPRCHAHVIRVASSAQLAAFAAAGMKPRLVPLPRPEINGAAPDGPPINLDDIIDFGLALGALT